MFDKAYVWRILGGWEPVGPVHFPRRSFVVPMLISLHNLSKGHFSRCHCPHLPATSHGRDCAGIRPPDRQRSACCCCTTITDCCKVGAAARLSRWAHGGDVEGWAPCQAAAVATAIHKPTRLALVVVSATAPSPVCASVPPSTAHPRHSFPHPCPEWPGRGAWRRKLFSDRRI